MSLFDLHMPGALTVEQVEELDLDHWLLFFQKTFFSMNVSVLSSTFCFKEVRG